MARARHLRLGDLVGPPRPSRRGRVDLLEGVAGREELGHDLLALHGEEAQLLAVLLVAQRPQQLEFRAGDHG
jgi:hypothetical protein